MEAGGLLPRQPAQGPPGVAPGTINVCAGQGPNGHAGNVSAAAIHDLNAAAAAAAGQLGIANQQQLHLQQQQHLQQHQQQQQQMGQAPGMGEVLTPKRQAVVDRLRRRIENYRRRQTDCIPRFDQSFTGLCEQNIHETLVLKQRFLENKTKRQPKKTDKKQNDPVGLSNVNVQQKFLKRTAEELEPASGGGGDGSFGEPPVKLQCTQAQHQHQQGPGSGGSAGPHHGHSQHQPGGGANSTGPTSGGGSGSTGSGNEGLTKFSVEIVQQLEFTASTANSQAQQISTNVTVKALTNASVKSDLLNASSSPKSGPDTPSSAANRTQVGGSGTGAPGPGNSGTTGPAGSGGIGCVDIGNLVECKQEPGLESDFVDLEQCAAALEKDAAANGTASSFAVFPEFIGDDTGDEIISSDTFKDLISEISDFNPEFMSEFDFGPEKAADTLPNNNVAVSNVAATVVTNNNGNNGNNVLSINNGQVKMEDDKDTIHQQQHNNSTNNGVNNNANNNNNNAVPANASPSALASSQYSPARLPYSGLDFKSEMSPAAQTLKQMAEQHQHKNQLGLGYNHTAAAAAAAARGSTARSPYAEFSQFGGASDYLGSPGSAGPTGGQTQPATGTATYHKNNTAPSFQSQQTSDMFVSSQNQFTAGLPDMKRPQPAAGGKPGMLGPSGGYKQPYSPYNNSPGPMPNHGSPQYPLPPRGSQTGGPNQTSSQGPFNNSTPPRPPSGPGTSTLQINQAQQLHVNNPGHQIQVSAGQHMQLQSDLKPGVSVAAQQGMFFNQQQTPNQTGPGNQPNDTYCTVSQSQTINFTQQSLRQRAAAAAASGVPQPGPAAAARGHPQQVPAGQVDQHQHVKLMQQQQLMRAQAMQQQQQHMSGMAAVRPPPPEYKAAQAQMMHGGIGIGQQPRFANAGAMRRVAQQPMPPSDNTLPQGDKKKGKGRKRKARTDQYNPECPTYSYNPNVNNLHNLSPSLTMNIPPPQQLVLRTPQAPVQNPPNSLETTGRKKGRKRKTTTNQANSVSYIPCSLVPPHVNNQSNEYQLSAPYPPEIIHQNYINSPMMRPQLAQQQQQALHATGGNMYMSPGGMGAIGGMHQMHQRLGYPRTNNQRPPNVNVGPPDGLGNSIASRGNQQEWRHAMLHQQQGFQMRSQFNQQGHQGGFGMGGAGGMQISAAQMQQQQIIRSQNGGIAGSGMPNSTQMQQLLSQQHQQQTLAMQQNSNQMSLQMQMSQASSVNSVNATGTGSPLHPHQQYGAGSPGVRSLPQQHAQPPATTTDPSVSTTDFTLEFLEGLPGESASFSAQELLNSLDTTASFNLDIL